MSYFICVSLHHPDKSVMELFDSEFSYIELNKAPVSEIVARKPGDPTYLVVKYMSSEELIDKGPKNRCCSDHFVAWLDRVSLNVKSISLFLFFPRGSIYTEKVAVKARHKITITEFLKIFPKIEENILYIIRRDYNNINYFDDANYDDIEQLKKAG